MSKVEESHSVTPTPSFYSAENATKRGCRMKKGGLARLKKHIYLKALSWVRADLEGHAIGNFNLSISALLDCVNYLHEHLREVKND